MYEKRLHLQNFGGIPCDDTYSVISILLHIVRSKCIYLLLKFHLRTQNCYGYYHSKQILAIKFDTIEIVYAVVFSFVYNIDDPMIKCSALRAARL